MEYGLVLQWLVLLHGIALLSWPIVATALPQWRDRGASLALPTGLLVLFLLVYWLGHFHFGFLTAVGALTLLGLASIAISYRRGQIPTYRRYVGPAIVFTAAFGFMIAVRAVDPAVHPGGGEKFLDFGLLKSILRATTLPPADMWFAGEPVSYYYGGHLISAVLTLLSGIEPRFSYNLALATFYGSLVTAAYGLAGAIADDKGLDRLHGGLAGAFFVGVASNLSTPGRILVWLAPESIDNLLVTMAPITIERLARGPAHFDYWTASRVIDGTINEFPLFAFFNGDLHAHMMSTPFLLLAAALFYQAGWHTEGRKQRLGLGIVAVSLIGGTLAVVNTWSFPTIAGLALLTVTLAPTRWLRSGDQPEPDRFEDRLHGLRLFWQEVKRLGAGVVAGGIVAILGVVAVAPFFLGTASGRSIAFWPERSLLGGLFLVHGAFLILFVWTFCDDLTSMPAYRSGPIMAGIVGVSIVALAHGFLGVFVFIPLIAVAWALVRSGHRTFEAVLIIAGAGLAMIVEVAFVKEQAGPGRLNTVFKTYMQIWVLWSVAAGVVVADIWDRHVPSRARLRRGALALLLVSVGIYGVLLVDTHFDDPGATTLDATAFVEDRHPREATAIEWLDRREGQPTILTEPGTKPYRWTNAPSSLTGLPTVVGWTHESGYRNRSIFRSRVADVDLLIGGRSITNDTSKWDRFQRYHPDLVDGWQERSLESKQRVLLEYYDVEYIYIGPKERTRYETIRITEVDGVEKIKMFDAVTLYRVSGS